MFHKKKVRIAIIVTLLYCFALVGMYSYEYYFKDVWFINKLEALKLNELDNNLTYSLDELSVTDDGFIQLTGWTFINGMSSKDQKVVVKLYTDNETEYLFADSLKREDVTRAYNNEANYDNSGFVVKLKKSQLNNEVYRIGIYLENKGRQVYIDTESIIYREAQQIAIEHLSNEVNLTLDLEQREMKYSIDAVEEKKFGFEMVGWSFAKNIDMRNSSIYILLDNGKDHKLIFDSFKVIREDVKQKFGSDHLDQTGFVVRIPYDLLDDESKYKTSIVIRNNKKDSILITDRVIEKSMLRAE
ncbi:hypothetical protein [Paenibacillus lentus]|uniref:Uncharacterized protein n=1 Tax=Paenibacillus lentus TaxID=1338368 RepID=A0A3S8RSK9_9BACL|nr:hypothetical protein [Paenibacillus lentus]AZK45976.1 hypothetical protein EIM92_06945 [Paenibacillus lentus]